MKKISILIAALIAVAGSLFALEVNKTEVEKFREDTVEFISYTGPHKVIDSAEAIRNIGKELGTVVGRNPQESVNTGNELKYSVIHAVDPNETGKLDADIIILGKNANVDHIKNLRRIIGTYLENAYGYSRKDADTLAVFITVYNAVYRGKLTDLQNIYKTVVTNNLSVENCGLSTTYKEWAGHSEIIIPLRDVKEGGLSTIDTSVITDSKVVESMKEDDDKNVDDRKQMVDIKERESEEASEKAQDSQKKAVEEQKKLDEEKKKTEEVKKEADTAKKEADKAEKEAENKKQAVEDKKQNVENKKQVAEEKKEEAKKNPSDKKAQDDAKKAQDEVKQAEEEVKQAEKEADKAEEKAEETKKEADKKEEAVKDQEKKQEEQSAKTEDAKDKAKEHQEFADKKQTEAQSERKEIAKDQGVIVKEEIAKAKMNTEHGLVIVDKSDMLSRIVKFNTENGEIVKNSPVTVIRNRTMYKEGDSYIAIAGENSGNGQIKLVLIDDENLEITNESDMKIAADSVLLKDGDGYYCVVEENGRNYVAKFGGDLSLKLKSNVEVVSCTPITLTNSGLVVTGADGTMKILNKSDLTETKESKSNKKSSSGSKTNSQSTNDNIITDK